MHTRPLSRIAAVVVLISSPLFGADYEPPRASNGKPDLSGVWTNSSLTRLSRPANIEGLVLSPEEAAELAGGHFHNVRAARDRLPSDPDKGAPEVLERLPPVGNYNAYWVDPGAKYGEVLGEIRSSWIIEPDDGRLPLRVDVRDRLGESRKARAGLEGPEVLSLGERCLIGFGGTGGPPMLNVLYNNYYQITQTPDHVVIWVEMVHDARIIRLDSEHPPPRARKWLGDSIGRWEGDTLVVETTSFHPARSKSGPLYYSDEAVVVERFTRVADDQILYEFSIDDESFYEKRIRGEMSFNAVEERVYEYACHEGNYAMPAILKGARLDEAEGTEP